MAISPDKERRRGLSERVDASPELPSFLKPNEREPFLELRERYKDVVVKVPVIALGGEVAGGKATQQEWLQHLLATDGDSIGSKLRDKIRRENGEEIVEHRAPTAEEDKMLDAYSIQRMRNASLDNPLIIEGHMVPFFSEEFDAVRAIVRADKWMEAQRYSKRFKEPTLFEIADKIRTDRENELYEGWKKRYPGLVTIYRRDAVFNSGQQVYDYEIDTTHGKAWENASKFIDTLIQDGHAVDQSGKIETVRKVVRPIPIFQGTRLTS